MTALGLTLGPQRRDGGSSQVGGDFGGRAQRPLVGLRTEAGRGDLFYLALILLFVSSALHCSHVFV